MLGLDGDARMNVRLGADASAQMSAVLLSDGAAELSLSAVDSINLRITAIEALRVDEGGEETRVTLSLRDNALSMINLLKLPSSDADAWLLARGDIPAGTYTGLRLRFDVASATITLNEAVTVGQQVWEAGTYPLEVPSGENNGIRIPFATITIGEDATADVVLKFDGNTTVHTVATGSGTLKMSPVLHSSVRVEDE
jgi:hypothetical protein